MRNNLRALLKERLDSKLDVSQPIQGVLGNAAGVVQVPGKPNYAYVSVRGTVIEVLNKRCASLPGLGVWIGKDPIEGDIVQVLDYRASALDGASGTSSLLRMHGAEHAWGGTDPTHIWSLQIMDGRVTAYQNLSIIVYPIVLDIAGVGVVSVSAMTPVDLTSYMPTAADSSLWLLVSIDATGNLVYTKGNTVLSADLALLDIPPVPSGSVMILAAVRLYTGQTILYEAISGSDILDLRGAYQSSSPASFSVSVDTPLNNQFLVYETATGLWKNKQGDHAWLASIGTNTHADIDTALSRLANTSGTNTGDVTLATDSGLSLSSQQLTMGTPSSLTASTTNAISAATHTHAVDGFLPLTGGTLTGSLTITPTANNTALLAVNDQAAARVLTVDSTNQRIGIRTASPTTRLAIAYSSTDYVPVLGAEIIPSDGTGWTLQTGWTGSYAAGFTHIAGVGSGTLKYTPPAGTVVSGSYYYVKVTVSSKAAGTLTCTVGQSARQAPVRQGATVEVTIRAKSSSIQGLYFTPSLDFDGTLTAISFKKVTSGIPSSINLVSDAGSTLQQLRLINGLGIGYQAMLINVTGLNNVVLGTQAMLVFADGSSNVAIGNGAAPKLEYGLYNMLIGGNSYPSLVTGDYNIGVGYGAGSGITSGSNNTFIGAQVVAATGQANVTNSVSIGHTSQVNVDNGVVLGNLLTRYGGLGIYAPTAHLHIVNLYDDVGLKIVANATQTNDLAQIGTGTDYLSITGDGTLKLNGAATVWDDLLTVLTGQRLESPSSRVTYNNAEGTIDFDNSTDVADYVVMNIQLSHKWKIGSVVYPHLHWWQPNANVPNWMIQYRWQVEGAAKTTAWTNLIRNAESFTYVNGTLNQITRFGAAGITPPGGASLSDILQVRLIRDKTNSSGLFGGADTTGVTVSAESFDIHIEMDTLGSAQEYVK
jgi:hypothetical protein